MPHSNIRAAVVALALVLVACSAAPTVSLPPGSSDSPQTSPQATPSGPTLAGRIEVSPSAVLMTARGQTAHLVAVATGADGSAVSVTWSSSDPAQVTVDNDGNVTAVTDLGGALIYAEASDRTTPVVVLVAQPAQGAVLVTDQQVVGEPQPLGDPNAMPANGDRYRVSLTGIDAPSAGAILLATGSARVGGRVLSSSATAAGVDVEYELVPLTELLARYSFDFDVPLDPRDAALGPVATNDQFASVDGTLPGTDSALAIEKKVEKEVEFEAGPLKCKASVAAKFKSTSFEIKATTGLTLQIEGRKEAADTTTPEHTKVVLTGPLALDVFGGLRAEAGFEGKAECALVKHIPIPLGGILAVVLAITVPIGLSASAEGKITAVSVELGPEGHLGTTVTVGFQCDSTACWAITDQVPDANNGISFKTKLDVLGNMRVEAEVALNVVTGLGARFGADYSLIDAKIGPVQSLNLAFDDDQVREPAYASAYDLKIAGSVTPGDDLKSAISRIFGGEVTLDLSVKYTPERPLAQSPVGVLSAEKARVQVDKPVKLFVVLDPKTIDYLLIPNVAEVRIARWKENALHLLTTIPVATSGQTRFEWTWTPGKEFVGMNELVAFVVTKLLPAIPLEIKADSTAYVEVVDACLPEGTPPPPVPPVPGSSAGASVPPAAPTPTASPEACEADVTITFDSTSHLHESHWIVAGNLERYVEGMPLGPDQPIDDFVGTGTYSGRAVDGLTMMLSYIRPPSCERDQLWVSDEGEVYLTGTISEEGWPGIDGPALLVAVFNAGEISLNYPFIFGLAAAAPLGGGQNEDQYLRAAEAECGDEWSETTTITLAPGVATP